MAPRIARKPARFVGTRSNDIAMVGNRPPFHKGIHRSTPPSLPHEGRDGSEDREKACRILGPRSHDIAVIGHPAPFHKGSREVRQGLAMEFPSFTEVVLGMQLGKRCDYSVPIFL